MKVRIFSAAVALVVVSNVAAQAQGTGMTTAAPPTAPAPAASDMSKDALVGRDAFSQDQTLMGPVERVETGADGRISAIFIRTGGFLGFGARLVSIPGGKFQMRGQYIQLQLSSDEIQKLPDVKGTS